VNLSGHTVNGFDDGILVAGQPRGHRQEWHRPPVRPAGPARRLIGNLLTGPSITGAACSGVELAKWSKDNMGGADPRVHQRPIRHRPARFNPNLVSGNVVDRDSLNGIVAFSLRTGRPRR
jgi:hypothetical protein